MKPGLNCESRAPSTCYDEWTFRVRLPGASATSFAPRVAGLLAPPSRCVGTDRLGFWIGGVSVEAGPLTTMAEPTASYFFPRGRRSAKIPA
jgi:hypothetical protein